jgi:hypothetical protein
MTTTADDFLIEALWRRNRKSDPWRVSLNIGGVWLCSFSCEQLSAAAAGGGGSIQLNLGTSPGGYSVTVIASCGGTARTTTSVLLNVERITTHGVFQLLKFKPADEETNTTSC